MICLRPYRWEFSPRYGYRREVYELYKMWVFGLRFCCVSVHYQRTWRENSDIRVEWGDNGET